jgi:hypothetical protein
VSAANTTTRDVQVPAAAEPTVAGLGIDRHETTDRSAYAEIDAWLREVAARNAAVQTTEIDS